MKKYNISFLVSLLSIVSCVNESIPKIDEAFDRLEIKLCGFLEQSVATKADDKGFYDGDAFGVYITDYDNGKEILKEEGNQADNVRFVYDAATSRWIPSETVYYGDPDKSISIMAYYPYSENIGDPSSYFFEVSKDQRTPASNGILGGYETSDFLYASRRNVKPTSETLSLVFRHQLSNLKVSLIKGAGWSDEEWNQVSKEVLITNTIRQSVIKLSDGSVSTVGNDRSQGIVPMLVGKDVWRAVVLPQVVPAGVPILSITIDRVAREYVYDGVYSYYGGKQNTITLSVNKKAGQQGIDLNLISEGIIPWEDDDEITDAKSRDYLVVNCPQGGKLKETLVSEGFNLGSIKNLKVEGILNADDFYFMRDELTLLQALNLLEVTIEAGEGNACNSIPDNAFDNKSSLMSIGFPTTLTSIGANSFRRTSLKGDPGIPEGVEKIGSMAFSYIKTINSPVRLPSTIKIVEYGAFYSSSVTGDLYLPEGLITLESNSFCYTNISTVNLPLSLVELGAAFRSCNTLCGRIEIPAGVKTIPSGCFEDCRNLDGELVLHEGLERISDYSFSRCKLTGALVIPSTVTSIGARAFDGSEFSSISLSKNLTSIGRYAFLGAYSSIGFILEIPEGITSIPEYNFVGFNIEELHLPRSIEHIGPNCFMYCYDMKSLQCDAINPPELSAGVFTGVPKDNFEVIVPETSVALYQEAPGWKEFKRIVPNKDFSISRRLLRTMNAGETKTFVLRAESGSSWKVESKPEWVTVSPLSGEGKSEIEVSVSSLTHGGGFRSGEIVYSLVGTDNKVSTKVEQYDYPYGDGDVYTVRTHLKGDGVKLVFMGDCYDAKDICDGKYLDNILEAVDHFFAIEPYNTYKDYFDICIVFACSADSGIGNVNTIRDAKFGSQYLLEEGVRLNDNVCWDYAVKSGYAHSDIAGICLVLNSDLNDGVTFLFDDDTFISACPVSRGAYPYDFRGVIQHEVGGHGFGKLGDEEIRLPFFIQTCNCAYPHVREFNNGKIHGWYENLSLDGDFKKVPWTHLIFDSKYSDIVDVYEGGFYHARGVFRSEKNSCMSTRIPYYSTISRESIVRRIMRYAGENYSFSIFKENDVTGAFTGNAKKDNK